MTRTKTWKEIRDKKLSKEARDRVADRVERELLEMDLVELRKRIAGLTQVEVAELLDTTQSHLSQLERRDDMLLSSLADLVHALGGELELRARFPDGRIVRITQFQGVREQLGGDR
jgi:DNA-binding transcriptional regulator YiaG